MPKWEYRILDSHELEGEGVYSDKFNRKIIEDYLNRLGKQGWEIISFDVIENAQRINFVGVAKRELVR